MGESSQYWKLVRVDAAEAGGGYKLQLISSAQEFFAEEFPDWINHTQVEDFIQRELLQRLRADSSRVNASIDSTTRDRHPAELCLRCYVSHPILQACFKRARLFGSGNKFTYRELLPFVLNDDGKPLTGTFTPFAIDILDSFAPEHRCSLARWVDLRVRRNPELNRFLLECGLQFSSDWALLNRANVKELAGIDRSLVEVFHQVYRRDRPQQHRQGRRQKCFDPTDEQMREMVQVLRQQQVFIRSMSSLLEQLKQIAHNLRQAEIWGRRGSPLTEPLEITDPITGETSLKEISDSTYMSDPEREERLELQTFCQTQLLSCLEQGIRAGICDRIRSLEQRPRYADLAHQVKPALRLLYFENKSQSQIAAFLGMTNQSQVSRILNPKELLLNIRQRTLETLLQGILGKVQELNIVEFPLSPVYLSNLIQQLDAFVDEQVFGAALAEINASRNRSMDSLYAQRLRQILTEQQMSSAA